ncbi:MAG: hypothetical protein ACI8VW_000196 [bacterium]|jgi:hypothetical protein
MIFRMAAALLSATLLLSACDGDSRPFSEAVEVRTLNLESIVVVAPDNTVPDIFLNINQGLQLGVVGIPNTGDPILLAANSRAWSVSDPTIASITDNGFLRAVANGAVDVSVSIGGIDSVGFGITVSEATLSEINAINAISDSATLERCLPQTFFATGTFSDDTNRNLDNVTWMVSDPTNARLFEISGTSTSLNALAAIDQLTLSATAPGGQSLDQPLIVSDSLQAIAIRPLPIILDVGEEREVSAFGVYSVITGETTNTTRDVDITDNVDWVVATDTANLSVSNVRGTKGLLTGIDADNDANLTAACGDEVHRVLVDINASETSTDTTLAFKFGNQVITGNQITLSWAANLASIPLLVATGSEYDIANDVTGNVDFQRQDLTSSDSAPFLINGNGTSTPTIQLTAIGTGIIVATQTTGGDAVGTITITVTNQ